MVIDSLILRDPREASYVRPMHPTQFCYKIIEMHDDQVSFFLNHVDQIKEVHS
jgi:hypothetical protein